MSSDNTLNTGAPKMFDRTRKVGVPIDFSSRHASVVAHYDWPPEYAKARHTSRDYILALREFINNTLQSLMDSGVLTSATITFKFNIAYIAGSNAVDWARSSLIIRDNAGGMDAERLAEALHLNCTQINPEIKTGVYCADKSLNRHGCGMKTSTVQLARFMSSVKHVATRKIGAECGYAFSYYDDAVSGTHQTQIYEDDNVFPAGTHGTEIYIEGLSEAWPNREFGESLYVKSKDKDIYGNDRLETTARTVMGELAMHLGFYYSWCIKGQRLRAAQLKDKRPDEKFPVWSSAHYKLEEVPKKIKILIEVWENNWTKLVGAHDVLPLFVAPDRKFGAPIAIPLYHFRTKEDGTRDERHGTAFLYRAKYACDYTAEDGPAPCRDDLRERQTKPFFQELFGLLMFEPASVCTKFKSISSSSVFVRWTGGLFDTDGFHTNVEKTGVVKDGVTDGFYKLLADVVHQKVNEWTQQDHEENEQEKAANAIAEAAYRDAHIAQCNTPTADGKYPLAEGEQSLYTRVLPPVNDFVERMREAVAGMSQELHDEMPWALITRLVTENRVKTEKWLERTVRAAFERGGPENKGGYSGRKLDEAVAAFMSEALTATVKFGQADILYQRDTATEPVAEMPPAERNLARKVVKELKALGVAAQDVFQCLMGMWLSKETDSVHGQMLGRYFTAGSVAAACHLRMLGIQMELFCYDVVGIGASAHPPKAEDEDKTLTAAQRSDPKLTISSGYDRQILSSSFKEKADKSSKKKSESGDILARARARAAQK